jgi:hypothetical protein
MNDNISASNVVLYPGSEEHDKPQALRFAVSAPDKHGHSKKLLTTLLYLNDTLDIFHRQMYLTSLQLVSQGREITRIFFLTRMFTWHRGKVHKKIRTDSSKACCTTRNFPAIETRLIAWIYMA